jgi:hypothetical protein
MSNKYDLDDDVVSALDELTSDQWHAVVRYMAPAMAKDAPLLLLDIVCKQAEQLAKGDPECGLTNHLYQIIEDLGLKLTAAD